eukprot:6331931-Lingulodinium_polyedra.AAC.1
MRDPYRTPNPWQDVRYDMVHRNNCDEYMQSWMKGLAAQRDKMRRAADTLEGCVGVLGARAR